MWQVERATITAVRVYIERDVLTADLYLVYENGGAQAFGGALLFNPEYPCGGNYAGLWLYEVMHTVDVESLNKLVGKTVLVRNNGATIAEIGRKDGSVWFNTAKAFRVFE